MTTDPTTGSMTWFSRGLPQPAVTHFSHPGPLPAIGARCSLFRLGANRWGKAERCVTGLRNYSRLPRHTHHGGVSTENTNAPHAEQHASPEVLGDLRKFSPEIAEKIVNFLRAGAFIETAAAAAGITKKTFYTWLKRGARAETGLLREFSDAVAEAQGTFEVMATAGIAGAAQDGNWQAWAWLLERKFPQRWGKKLEVSGAGGGPIDVRFRGAARAKLEAAIAAVEGAAAGEGDNGEAPEGGG